MSIETVRISEKAKRQLIAVKQRTGIEHWNVLCRWAFCLSLADDTLPSEATIPLDSNVEMTWRTFGGEHHEMYLALLKHRTYVEKKGTTQDSLGTQFKLHLHRGIGMLATSKDLIE
ncbi:MAG TPA: DNA sulfur modification protein DndE [Candidatus Poseidoniales archaeon]|nr:MAG TPA: DNA sulfur modification protein DndE [Candidatus Poseidoniales archaeon]HII62665.1 DNA sulfur modification protein DndE [Candidatus Poseidoniaceae archaeon]|tara:strand:+ start:2177 stop:2524 length:348 start_codon:yes stop_codon:yes gene_type:complete